jgi:hypothetical protein
MDPRTALSDNALILEKNIREHLTVISSQQQYAKSVKFSFHIPVEIKRETILGIKLAFDEMLFVEFADVSELLLHKANQLQACLRAQKEDIQKRTAFKDYLLKLEECCKVVSRINSIDAAYDCIRLQNNVISQLYLAWHKLRDGFDAYIKSINIDKSLRQQCDEFHAVYLDGFYQFICLHYRLQLIRKILAQDEPIENGITQYEVQEIRGEVVRLSMSKQRASALHEIAQLDPDESLPIVLYELNSVLRKIQNTQAIPHLEEQEKFLKEGIATIFDGEQKQRVQSLAEITSLAFRFDKHKFKQDMNALVAGIDSIHLTQDTLKNWEELALLFEGLHLRFYRAHLAAASTIIEGVPRLNYATSSSAIDGAFHSLTGFYRINIGEIYYAAAEKIHRKIEQYQTAYEAISQAKGKPEIGVVVEEYHNSDLVKITTIAPRREGLAIAANNRRLLVDSTHYSDDAEILDDLSIKSDVREDIRDDLKMIKLADVVNSERYQLREHHLKKLHFLEATIASEFAEYVNSGGGWSRLGYERVHAQLVQEKLEKITSTKDMATRLKILIDFRAQLKKLNSVTILAKVEKILLLSHSQLMDSLQPRAKLTKRSSKASMLLFPTPSTASSSTHSAEQKPVEHKVGGRTKKNN